MKDIKRKVRQQDIPKSGEIFRSAAKSLKLTWFTKPVLPPSPKKVKTTGRQKKGRLAKLPGEQESSQTALKSSDQLTYSGMACSSMMGSLQFVQYAPSFQFSWDIIHAGVGFQWCRLLWVIAAPVSNTSPLLV